MTWAAAVAAVAVLAGTPREAQAAPTLRTKVTTVPQGAAQERYKRASAAYSSERWAEAGLGFSDVLDQIPENPTTRSIRATVVLDSITAYRTAYEISGEPQHLHTALETYYRYFSVFEETYNSPNIPRNVVVARFALKDEIQRIQDEAAMASPAPGARPAEAPAGPSRTEPADAKGRSVRFSAGGQAHDDRNAVPFIATGAAVMALGAGASSMIAIGAIGGKQAREDQKDPAFSDEQRDRIDQRGKTMNHVFIAGLVATPLLLGAGAALLGIGIHRKRTSGRITAIAPTLRGNFAGITVSGRF